MSKATDTDLLPMSKLTNMKENKTSKRERKKQQITNHVYNKLLGRSDLAANSVATITDVCQNVENAVRKKDKIDKIDVVIAIMCNFFPLTAIEIEFVKKTVQFLMDNKMIKKITMQREIYCYLKKVVINNLLFRDEHSS
jgi:hypothetical protein